MTDADLQNVIILSFFEVLKEILFAYLVHGLWEEIAPCFCRLPGSLNIYLLWKNAKERTLFSLLGGPIPTALFGYHCLFSSTQYDLYED